MDRKDRLLALLREARNLARECEGESGGHPWWGFVRNRIEGVIEFLEPAPRARASARPEPVYIKLRGGK